MSSLQSFVELYTTLDETTSTNARRSAMAAWFATASDADLAWGIFVLAGRRLRRPVSGARLREWASAHTGLPAWLVEASYHTVGDLAETLAILCSRGSEGAAPTTTLAAFMEEVIRPLAGADEVEQRAVVTGWWHEWDERTCLVAHKLLTGGLRVGVSATLATRALAEGLEQPHEVVEHHLMGSWEPGEALGARLRAGTPADADRTRPYPFYLATPLDEPPDALGARDAWLAEWKWDGIRAQLIVRGGEVTLWSRGEERVTERFPEVSTAARALPGGTVLDGELVVMRDGTVRPFAELQTRIGRKHVSAATVRRTPVVFLAFDLLEDGGRDARERPLAERRQRLEEVVRGAAKDALQLSPTVPAATWEGVAAARAGSRARGVEGVMLKRLDSRYRSGRPRGEWWKWKVEPLTMDAVLVYAQSGHGKRANLHTDYTFAVRDGDELVPVAKAYSGLDDAEIARLDRWIRANTLERFGPVRVVKPEHVFELGFEAIQPSSRHKAGIAVRFPRILRWRTDKAPADADSLQALRALMHAVADAHPAGPPAGDQALSLFGDATEG